MEIESPETCPIGCALRPQFASRVSVTRSTKYSSEKADRRWLRDVDSAAGAADAARGAGSNSRRGVESRVGPQERRSL